MRWVRTSATKLGTVAPADPYTRSRVPRGALRKETDVKNIFRAVALTSVACLMLVLTACNTTKGFGEDLQSGGGNLADEARDQGARP
jgi:predicted small secreted protein